MKFQLNKELIQEQTKDLINNSKFMHGINHGFHDSILPEHMIKSYSNPTTIKKPLRDKESALSQDLGLRMGSMIASKALIGGTTYAGLQSILPEDTNQAFSVVPSVAASWLGSDLFSKNMPRIHRKIVGEKNSIYRKV